GERLVASVPPPGPGQTRLQVLLSRRRLVFGPLGGAPPSQKILPRRAQGVEGLRAVANGQGEVLVPARDVGQVVRLQRVERGAGRLPFIRIQRDVRCAVPQRRHLRSGRGFARPCRLQRGRSGVGRLAGGADGGLLASYIAIEFVQRVLDLGLRRPQDVQAGGRLRTLVLHFASTRGRVVSGRRRHLADSYTDDHDGRNDLGEVGHRKVGRAERLGCFKGALQQSRRMRVTTALLQRASRVTRGNRARVTKTDSLQPIPLSFAVLPQGRTPASSRPTRVRACCRRATARPRSPWVAGAPRR